MTTATLDAIQNILDALRTDERTYVAGRTVTKRDTGVIEYEIGGHGAEPECDAARWLWRNQPTEQTIPQYIAAGRTGRRSAA